MLIMKEESFGPVIAIAKVESNEQALEFMSDSSYGLTASVHGKDFDCAKKFMNKLDYGTVYFNACDRVSPHVPWSGRKASGTGSSLSTYGIREFLKPKAWQLRS